MRKFNKLFLAGLCAVVGVGAGATACATSAPDNTVTVNAEEVSYSTKNIAMLGRVAGWHGNGNFEIRLTLGECDWTGESQQSYAGAGDLAGALRGLDFFNHIEIGGKTLAEWGCTACYDNIYWLNSGEPDYTITIPLAMGSENMAAATAAGISANTCLTVKEGALIPSHAYLQGDTTATVYRAGCDFVATNSDVAYGIMSVGKTEVEAMDYVTSWDATYGNAYFGISLKGDDYAGNGQQREINQTNYQSSVYTANRYANTILIDGVAGKVEPYGLYNLGADGAGYFSFVIRTPEADAQAITIPAGTLFPAQAMTSLFEVNGNPVYMMYETQEDVTFYKQNDGTWAKPYVETATEITSVKVSGSEADNFTIFKLGTHDYPETLDNYGGDVKSVEDFLVNTNFYTHVLINDVAIGSSNEAFLNVWGNKGAIAVRTTAGLTATKITILAGCQIPSYNALSTGSREVYVTTEDVVFYKVGDEFISFSGYAEQKGLELELYKAGMFREAEEAQRLAIVAEAKVAMNEADTQELIDSIFANATAQINLLKTEGEYAAEENAALGAAKDAAKAELEAYKAEVEYFVEQVAERAALVEAGLVAIKDALTIEDVNAELADAKAAIDGLQTKAEAVAIASEGLDAYKSAEGYFREEQAAERATIVATAKEQLATAENATKIEEIVADAKARIDNLLTAAEYYETKDSAFIARIEDFYMNTGNLILRVTIGDADWTERMDNVAYTADDGSSLAELFDKLGFFDHVKFGDKTLRELGCVAFYDNAYDLDAGEPDHIITLHLSMGKDNLEAAVANGLSKATSVTIMEGALIPSHGYLQHTGDVVYRAGASYVTTQSGFAYGIESTAQVKIESVKYVQGHDGVCGYFGISFEGDDYYGDGTELAVNPNYYFDNKFSETILLNGLEGLVGYYGLFNLGEEGVGYYAFQVFLTADELQSITIPAGTLFPTRAMTTLIGINGNPVYIMYEVAEDIVLYKTDLGYVTYADYAAAQLNDYKAGMFRDAEEAERVSIITAAQEAIANAANNSEVDVIIENTKAAIDALKTAAQYADEELANDKQAAVAEIETYKADVVYMDEQAAQKAELVAAGVAGVAAAADLEAIANAVATAKTAIDGLVTREDVITAAVADVEAYRADGVYNDEEAAVRAGIIETFIAALDNVTAQADVEALVASAKADLDEVKTVDQLEAEELAAAKETANETVNDLKRDIDFDLYSEDNVELINDLFTAAKAAIEAAETVEEVEAAVEAFETALEEVPQNNGGEMPDEEDTSDDENEATDSENNENADDDNADDNADDNNGGTKAGCMGTVTGLTGGALALGMAAVALLKKKKED